MREAKKKNYQRNTAHLLRETQKKRLASLYARNTKTLIVVDGKVERVPVTQIIAALDSDIQYRQTADRLYLARE